MGLHGRSWRQLCHFCDSEGINDRNCSRLSIIRCKLLGLNDDCFDMNLVFVYRSMAQVRLRMPLVRMYARSGCARRKNDELSSFVWPCVCWETQTRLCKSREVKSEWAAVDETSRC
jgi:hypothetical protein